MPSILDKKNISSPSVYSPAALLRQARRQKGLAADNVPPVCILDPDGTADALAVLETLVSMTGRDSA